MHIRSLGFGYEQRPTNLRSGVLFIHVYEHLEPPRSVRTVTYENRLMITAQIASQSGICRVFLCLDIGHRHARGLGGFRGPGQCEVLGTGPNVPPANTHRARRLPWQLALSQGGWVCMCFQGEGPSMLLSKRTTGGEAPKN